jgi:hypothetical protein
MTDDLLARATRALRDETGRDDASGRFTRSRIMATTHERRIRKRTKVAFLIPVAATFVAASAVGATGGPKQALESVARVLGIFRAEPVVAPPSPLVSRRPSTEKPEHEGVAEPSPEVVPPPAEEPESPLPEEPKPEPAKTVVAVRAPTPAAPREAPPDPSFELYKAAHQAHFVDQDSARALMAWDAYLRGAPRGAFVLEARYNRALCLVRLGRAAEARAALAPFAQGRFGAYRKDDAEKLIAALASEP